MVTPNSRYRTNLDTTLAALSSTNSGYSFFNRSTGQGPDRVNSIALCRGDVDPSTVLPVELASTPFISILLQISTPTWFLQSLHRHSVEGPDRVNSIALCRGDVEPSFCRSCLSDSIVMLREMCPNQIEAIGYYDYCFLRYSNDTIFWNGRIKFYVSLINPQNSTVSYWSFGVLTRLISMAAGGGSLRKFATGNASGPGYSTIYGLVQCTPDLSERQCRDCLEDSFNRIPAFFNGNIGGRILLPTCNFRFEVDRFFDATPVISSPPSLPPAAPPSQGGNNSVVRTVIAIIVPLVSVVIIATSICIFIRLRRKKD